MIYLLEYFILMNVFLFQISVEHAIPSIDNSDSGDAAL